VAVPARYVAVVWAGVYRTDLKLFRRQVDTNVAAQLPSSCLGGFRDIQ
jgi:hypothetical protein